MTDKPQASTYKVPSVLRRSLAAYEQQGGRRCSGGGGGAAPLSRPRRVVMQEMKDYQRTVAAFSMLDGWFGGKKGKGKEADQSSLVSDSSTSSSSASSSSTWSAPSSRAQDASSPSSSSSSSSSTTVSMGPLPDGVEWTDHPETIDERRSRERVEYWKEQLLRRSPMIQFMARHLIYVNCSPLATIPSFPNSNPIYITSCPPHMAGGFSPSMPGRPYNEAGILICSNRITDKKHLEQTMAHEMVHWWDHCRFRVDWGDLRQVACSEIRAATLSGDCRLLSEWNRLNFSFAGQMERCVRRRAALSIMGNPQVAGDQEKAYRAVDEVWEKCSKDTRPFDEIY